MCSLFSFVPDYTGICTFNIITLPLQEMIQCFINSNTGYSKRKLIAIFSFFQLFQETWAEWISSQKMNTIYLSVQILVTQDVDFGFISLWKIPKKTKEWFSMLSIWVGRGVYSRKDSLLWFVLLQGQNGNIQSVPLPFFTFQELVTQKWSMLESQNVFERRTFILIFQLFVYNFQN